jgi:hypothetical protein
VEAVTRLFRVELRRHDPRPFLSAVLLGKKPVVREVGGGVVTKDAEHGAVIAWFIELGTGHHASPAFAECGTDGYA